MNYIASLTNLTHLGLEACDGVTDAGVKELVALKKLTQLDIPRGAITDRSLRILRESNQLHLLRTAWAANNRRATNPDEIVGISLWDTGVTDAGLKEFADLKNLTHLGLSGSKFTNAAVKELVTFKNLTSLSLHGKEFTDAGLKDLALLNNLTRLELDYIECTDAGMKHIAPLTTLTVLTLENLKLTDAGLKKLTALTSLSELHARKTQITKKGIQEFQKAVLKCQVIQEKD